MNLYYAEYNGRTYACLHHNRSRATAFIREMISDDNGEVDPHTITVKMRKDSPQIAFTTDTPGKSIRSVI